MTDQGEAKCQLFFIVDEIQLRESQATMSSTAYNPVYGWIFNASSAVDGSTEHDLVGGSCSISNPEHTPWWQVRLDGLHMVHSVQVFSEALSK